MQDRRGVARPNGYGFERRLSAVNLVGCPPAQNRHRSVGVVPIAVDVQSMLDCAGFETEERQSLPEFEGAEESLNFSVETRGADAAFDQCDTEAMFQGVTKSLAELTAMIGNEEAGLAVDFDGAAHQAQKVGRGWGVGIDFEGDQFAGESIEDGGDGESNLGRQRIITADYAEGADVTATTRP